MRLLFEAVVIFAAAWLRVGSSSTPGTPQSWSGNAISSSFIVFLSPKAQLESVASSPHAEFYEYLRSRSVSWETTKEYRDRILTGAVITLGNLTDLSKLTEATGVEAVYPNYARAMPQLPTNDSASVLKRTTGGPWSHVMTGVDKLHEANYFGQGIKIGLIDGGVDYNHPALGGGFGPEFKIIGGYDFVGDAFTGGPRDHPQPSNYPLDPCDDHATHMAGIIGANPGFRHDILGVAYKSKINSYRASGCAGYTREDVVIEALLRANQDGNDIICITYAFPTGWGMSAMAKVASRVADEGRVVVVAVGNNGKFGSWYADNAGHSPGIIQVGSAGRIDADTQDAYGATVARTSSHGPNYDMYLGPMLSAPGKNIASTFPRELSSVRVGSGTSQAAAFTTGAVALWLEAKGSSAENALAARAAFQNTAIPVRQRPDDGPLIDTVSHQGAGLIQVYDAVYARGSLLPAEMLLNDTINPRLSWKLELTNFQARPVTYAFTHEPAGTAPTINGIKPIGEWNFLLPSRSANCRSNVVGPRALLSQYATVIISPDKATIPAGSSQSIDVLIMPPQDLDVVTFPVYSGYIKATSSDGSILRSTYLGVAAPMKHMRVLDDTQDLFDYSLPRLQNGRGDPINERKSYSMKGTDAPYLVFRLAAGTPLLRLDLVDSRSYFRSTSAQSLGTPSSSRSLIGQMFDSFKKLRLLKKSRSFRGSNTELIVRAKMIGAIFVQEYVPRDLLDIPDARRTHTVHRVRRFADGRAIPNGSYKLLLRALRVGGNRDVEADYEVWMSPRIDIKRA